MSDAFRRHIAGMTPGKVLDVGASGKRPWFRNLWEGGGWTYHGMDMVEGPNIHIRLGDDPWKFPIPDAYYDAVISGNMLEHNEFFWLTFLEMSRVLKMGGMMIHVVPSRGLEHPDPQDCWRWYRDGMQAMAKWAGFDCVERTTDWAPDHFAYLVAHPKYARRAPVLRATMRNEGTEWGDTIGVFVKTCETRDTTGMEYLRHFVKLHEASPAVTDWPDQPPSAPLVAPVDAEDQEPSQVTAGGSMRV